MTSHMNNSWEGNCVLRDKFLLTSSFDSISASKFLRKLLVKVGLSRVQMQLFREVIHFM